MYTKGPPYGPLVDNIRYVNGPYTLHIVFPDMADQNLWPVHATISKFAVETAVQSKIKISITSPAHLTQVIGDFMGEYRFKNEVHDWSWTQNTIWAGQVAEQSQSADALEARLADIGVAIESIIRQDADRHARLVQQLRHLYACQSLGVGDAANTTAVAHGGPANGAFTPAGSAGDSGNSSQEHASGVPSPVVDGSVAGSSTGSVDTPPSSVAETEAAETEATETEAAAPDASVRLTRKARRQKAKEEAAAQLRSVEAEPGPGSFNCDEHLEETLSSRRGLSAKAMRKRDKAQAQPALANDPPAQRVPRDALDDEAEDKLAKAKKRPSGKLGQRKAERGMQQEELLASIDHDAGNNEAPQVRSSSLAVTPSAVVEAAPSDKERLSKKAKKTLKKQKAKDQARMAALGKLFGDSVARPRLASVPASRAADGRVARWEVPKHVRKAREEEGRRKQKGKAPYDASTDMATSCTTVWLQRRRQMSKMSKSKEA